MEKGYEIQGTNCMLFISTFILEIRLASGSKCCSRNELHFHRKLSLYFSWATRDYTERYYPRKYQGTEITFRKL